MLFLFIHFLHVVQNDELAFTAEMEPIPYNDRQSNNPICLLHINTKVFLPFPPAHPNPPNSALHLEGGLISENTTSPVVEVPCAMSSCPLVAAMAMLYCEFRACCGSARVIYSPQKSASDCMDWMWWKMWRKSATLNLGCNETGYDASFLTGTSLPTPPTHPPHPTTTTTTKHTHNILEVPPCSTLLIAAINRCLGLAPVYLTIICSNAVPTCQAMLQSWFYQTQLGSDHLWIV